MSLPIRDARQMKALTGLSRAQFAPLVPVFSEIYGSTEQDTYDKGVAAGTRRRKPGGGSKGKLPTMPEKLQFVLYYDKTYPTFNQTKPALIYFCRSHLAVQSLSSLKVYHELTARGLHLFPEDSSLSPTS
jgi:hypothetical protein